MNKNLFKSLAFAAVAVIAGACAKESEQLAGPSNVTFEVSTPEIATKAIGDGMTATKLYYQVFDADGNAIEGLGVQNKDLVSGKTTVSFQLIKDQTYNFIFWAQTAETGYYIIDEAEGLKKITADYTTHKGANDENRDAFFAVEKGLKITGPVSKTIELKRPFAQVNIGTNDELKAGTITAPAINLTGATSKVVIKGIPTVFAPLATTPETMLTGATDVTFMSAAVPTEKLVVKGVEYNYLAMNYVFAPAEGTVCDLTAEFALVGRAPIPLSSPATPINRNYRTNILGKLLTSSADFNIEVDPGFGGDEEVNLESIKNEASLRALFATGGTAKLAADLILDKSVAVTPGKEVTLDLNGKTISNTEDLWRGDPYYDWALLSVRADGSLTIKGTGVLKAKENDCYAVDVQDGGKLVIEDGTYVGNAHAVYVYEGTAEIRGGKYSIQQKSSNPDPYGYVLNCYDKNRENGIAKIIVSGGEFEKFNPADCVAEGAHTNFLAPGYKSTKVGDSYVVTKENVTPVADQAGLDVVMANLTSEPATINLPAGNFTTYGKDVTKGKTLTFNGSGAENTNFIVGKNLGVSGEGNSDYSLENADVTFNNLTISTGDGLSYNYRGFVRAKSLTFVNCTIKERLSYWGGVVKFINCKFEPNTYKKEDGSILPDYNITTYQGTEFSFENCSFKSAGKFMNLYKEQNVPYVVRVKDCTFIATKIDKPVLNMKSYTDVEYKIYFEGTNIAKTEAGVEFPLYGGETASNAEVYVNNTLVWSKGQAF
mgnify:CR=1 FL=1